MLIALGASLNATKGWAAPEVGETYTSAQQLCQHLEDPHQLFPVLRGLWSYYHVRAELQTAHVLGEQLLTLAQHVQDAAMLLGAHCALGTTFFFAGGVAKAHTHYMQGIALYDPQQHRTATFLYGQDTGVSCHTYTAWTLWSLGYPDQGRRQIKNALALAQHLAYPFSLSLAMGHAAIFHQFRREVRWTQERAAATMTLAQEQGFPLYM